MISFNGSDWLYDIQPTDILHFQKHMKLLLTVYGLTYDMAGSMIDKYRNYIGDCCNLKKKLKNSEYAYLRLWMQNKSGIRNLQKEALYYCTHRNQRSKIIKEKIEGIYLFYNFFQMGVCERVEDHSVMLCDLWDRRDYMSNSEIKK